MTYGNQSEKGRDIQVIQPDGDDFKVQVKTVSAYSTTRTISPLHHGWDELHLVYLNRMLQPERFWIVRDNSIVCDEKPLSGKKCSIPEKTGTGSRVGRPNLQNLLSGK